jgi:hypothetical protein
MGCGGGGVEDDERLAFGFQIGLCDEVDDGAVFGEDFSECRFEFVRFDSFFEVADVDSKEGDLALLRFHVWGMRGGRCTLHLEG